MGIISQAAHFLNFVSIGISWTIETVIRGYLKLLLENVFIVKDTDSEKAPSNNSSAYGKYEYGHLGGWYIKSTFYKRFLNWNKIFQKIR